MRYSHTHTHKQTFENALFSNFRTLWQWWWEEEKYEEGTFKFNLAIFLWRRHQLHCVENWMLRCVLWVIFSVIYFLSSFFFALIFFTKKKWFLQTQSFVFLFKPWNNNLLCLFSFSCSSSILFSRNIIINM